MHAVTSSLRALWRQRRFGAVLAVAALIYLAFNLDQIADGVGTRHEALILGFAVILTLLIAAFLTALFCAILRPFRFVPLILALSLPFMVLPLPRILDGYVFPGATELAVIFFWSWFLFEPRVDRILPKVGYRESGRLRAQAGPRAILNATIPGLGPVASYWGALYDVERDPERGRVRKVRYAMGRGVYEEQTVSIGPISATGGGYAFVNEASERAMPMTRGIYDVQIGEPDAKGRRRIVLSLERPACPIRIAFLEWIGDRMGSEADAVAAKLRRRCDPSDIGREMRIRMGEA